MNNMKIFFLTIISFFSAGLHFSSMAMEISTGKEIIGTPYQSWQQALYDLLQNKENWSRTGPTDTWMYNAAEIAVRDTKSGKTTNKALMEDLETIVSTHYTGLSESNKTFMGNVIKLDFSLKLDLELERQEKLEQELERQKKEDLFKGLIEAKLLEKQQKMQQSLIQGKSSWQQALDALSNLSNWKGNFPTDEWMRDAIDPAVQSIQDGKKQSEVMHELDEELRKHYGSSLSRAQESALQSIKKNFLVNIDNALDIQLQQKIKEQKFLEKQQWAQEAREKAAHHEQKVAEDIQRIMREREEERAKVIRYDIGWKDTVKLGNFAKDLLDLSKPENWYEDTAMKQQWIERTRKQAERSNVPEKQWMASIIESSVPTQQWIEKATDSAIKLITEKTVTENEIVRHLGDALWNYYKNKKSNKAWVETIDLVQQRFIKHLNEKLYPELAEQKRAQTALAIRRAEERKAIEAGIKAQEEFEEAQKEFERKPMQEQLRIKMKQAVERQKAIKEQQETIKEQIKQSPLYRQFKQLLTLDSIGKGWFRAPLPRWKDDIVQAAFELLNPRRDEYGRVDDRVTHFVIKQIDDAITNYAKTKSYFPDWTLIAMDSKEIGDKIIALLRHDPDPARRIEPTFVNKLLFPKTISEQEMYEQAIKKSQQHDIERAQQQEEQYAIERPQQQEEQGFTQFFRNLIRKYIGF